MRRRVATFPTTDVIATRTFEVVRPTGRTGIARVSFLRPRRVGPCEWACGVLVTGLSVSTRPFWPRGVDGVQALLLAVCLADSILSSSPEYRSRRLTFCERRDLGLVRDVTRFEARMAKEDAKRRAAGKLARSRRRS